MTKGIGASYTQSMFRIRAVFWERPDVLTVSIHGDPRVSYPYFTGGYRIGAIGANVRRFFEGLAAD